MRVYGEFGLGRFDHISFGNEQLDNYNSYHNFRILDPFMIDSLQVGNEYPVDAGPIYTETLLGLTTNWKVSAFGLDIIEPCNGLSAFLFVLIVGYWALRMRKHGIGFKQQPFMSLALPVLLIGGIGGTLFHALRLYEVFLIMDWLPIMLLSLGTSVYFFTKVVGRWWYSMIILLAAFSFSGFLFEYLLPKLQWFSLTAAIGLNYVIMASLVLVPIFLWLRKTEYKYAHIIILALISFLFAVSFRTIDSIQPPAIFFFGTHWLWHSFGAVACHLILAYLWRTDNERIGASSKELELMSTVGSK